MRVGTGYGTADLDDHRPLVLGGVRLRGEPDHDAGARSDVVSDALARAIRGAAGLPGPQSGGPDGAGSQEALDRAVRSVEAENYQVVNVDVSVFAGSGLPSGLLRERGSELRRLLAGRLHVRPDQVSVKRGAGGAMGWTDRETDLAAVAVVLLDQMTDLDGLHASARSGR